MQSRRPRSVRSCPSSSARCFTIVWPCISAAGAAGSASLQEQGAGEVNPAEEQAGSSMTHPCGVLAAGAASDVLLLAGGCPDCAAACGFTRARLPKENFCLGRACTLRPLSWTCSWSRAAWACLWSKAGRK